jgi:hypothetical protein
MTKRAVADTSRLATRDEIARALCESFYACGTIYEGSVQRTIEHRWKEWRPQADDILKRFAIFPRAGEEPSR